MFWSHFNVLQSLLICTYFWWKNLVEKIEVVYTAHGLAMSCFQVTQPPRGGEDWCQHGEKKNLKLSLEKFTNKQMSYFPAPTGEASALPARTSELNLRPPRSAPLSPPPGPQCTTLAPPPSFRHLQCCAMAGRGGAQRTNGTAASSKICQFKLVLLGESAVGKSSLVLRFVKGQFHEYQESTIGGERRWSQRVDCANVSQGGRG